MLVFQIRSNSFLMAQENTQNRDNATGEIILP
jgi:hypothetical protein